MSQQLVLKAKGLYTNSNQFSAVPEGALAKAENVVIDRDGVVEPKRGVNRLAFALPSGSDRADKLSQYQSKLLIHYNTTKLAYYDSSSGVNTYTGSFAHPDPLLARIRTVEANQNLYFTTSTGIQKLDIVTGTPGQAGMYPGLDCKAGAVVNASGWMATNTQVAYRVLWGIYDANNNLVVGSPSQRAILANTSGGNQDTSLQITIPAGITTSHFYQIYRSNLSASSTTVPDDNCQLVYGGNPTAGQISAKTLTVTDATPDSLKGAALYTNDSQQGILQQNEIPPFAYDMATFRNCVFFANTKTKQTLNISILAVGGSGGIQLADTITIAGTTYTASAAENAGALQYQLVTAGSPSQNINDTALSLIRVINQNATNTTVYARYTSSSTSLPGQIQIQERVLGGASYAATVSGHGTAFSPTLPTVGTTVSSSNQVNLNGLMYSKQQVPEAVPILNIFYVGSASKKILRILALRDSLFILKEDGVYRCTGTAPGNFSIDLLDSATILMAPESAVTLNNKIYALCSQGVVSITDTGVDVISRPIEDSVRALFGPALTSLQNYSFGVSYESDRKYILWTVSAPGDTYATQAFVYNIFTGAWTKWTRGQKHGVVLSADDKLYLCDPTSNYILQERKALDFNDYSDETIAINIVSASGTSIVLTSAADVSVGDLIYQSATICSIVSAVSLTANTVTVSDTLVWAVGATSLLKSIACLVEFLACVQQNPGALKHWREAVLLFRQNNFNTASINFYSDVSGSVEGIQFTGSSIYGWGRFIWGTGSPWGGVNRTLPFRTYVPLEKQRCDLLSVQFSCQNVWARFQLEGLSLVLKPLSERVAK